MPKVPVATTSTSTAFNSIPHILRRNQACHQCRKRKLKCDANRPCSTCVRSHAYAVAHAPAGSNLPPHPDCTFDSVAPIEVVQQVAPEQPRNRFERLERKINELEAMLRDKERGETSSPASGQDSSASTTDGLFHMDGVIDPALLESMQNLQPNGSMEFNMPSISSSPLNNLADIASLVGTSSPQGIASLTSVSPSGSDTHFEVISVSWPKNLPQPEFLRHLVEAYFAFNPDAPRLFHGPTFMASLSLPCSHPEFPSTAILHAICAVGSQYTAVVPPPPIPSYSVPADDPWGGRMKRHEKWTETFAEQQVRYAKAEIEVMIFNGVKAFEVLQSQLLIASWYWCNAMWSSLYTATGQSVRFLLPLGLNMCAPFHGLFQGYRAPSLLPPAKTVAEDETRRNVFWMAYAAERIHGCTHAWAVLLDDLDVSQLLPLRQEHFEQGVPLPPDERQWSHDRDVLLSHAPERTDGFVLYIKSTILLSQVKNFNMRFRARFYLGDPAVASAAMLNGTATGKMEDVRETPAFVELDQRVPAFLNSFPPNMRNPMQDGIVNPHLFAACNAAHLAQILLHESHATIGSSTCVSSVKILNAARRILNLLYDINATSYDLVLLGYFPIICWFMAGRVLVRFLAVAQQAKNREQCSIVQAELEFIRTTLTRVGERIPLAHRYGKMLHDFIRESCGDATARTFDRLLLPVPQNAPRVPSPPDHTFDLLQSVMNYYP